MSIPNAEPFPRLRSKDAILEWADRLVDNMEMHVRAFGLISGAITLVNGSQDNVNIRDLMQARIVGPTGAFTITGIGGGYPGRMLVLINSTSNAMTIAHASTASAAPNRITCPAAVSYVTAAASAAALLTYDNVRCHLVRSVA